MKYAHIDRCMVGVEDSVPAMQKRARSKRVKTTLYLPEEPWKAAKKRAIETNVHATYIVTKALEQYLKGARQ